MKDEADANESAVGGENASFLNLPILQMTHNHEDKASPSDPNGKPPPDPSLLPSRKMLSEKKPPLRSHTRSVSWSTDPPLPGKPDEVYRQAWHESLGQSLQPSASDDIVNAINPFEDEAQRALLKAIETRHKSQRSLLTQSSILSSVPDDRSHNFEDVVTVTDFATEPISPPIPQNIWDDQEDTRSASSRQKRPLLPRSSPSQSGLTVEQTLFDLTNAIAAVHGESLGVQSRHNSADHGRHKRHVSTSSVPDVASTAEEMAYNAALLAEKHIEQENVSGPWAKVLENLGAVREDSRDLSDGGMTSKNSEESNHGDIEQGRPSSNKKKRAHHHSIIHSAHTVFRDDWTMWTEFFRPRQERLRSYFKVVSLYILLPLITVSTILFYFGGNPPTGENKEGKENKEASASWILLFCARQVITFCLALGMQTLVIDFLALRTRLVLKSLGPVVTLLIVQSKGWPQIVFWWSLFDFALLHGDRAISHHWLFYQDLIRVFSEKNPSGDVVNNPWYTSALVIGISLSLVVALKRFLVGLYLGRQTFANYGQPLAQVMEKMLYIGEVAGLAKEIESHSKDCEGRTVKPRDYSTLRGMLFVDDDEDKSATGSTKSFTASDMVIDPTKRDLLTGSLNYSQKLKLLRLLDAWEEPVHHDSAANNEIASISAVLRFRKALTFIHREYPFSTNFGNADDRESCIESAQEVYQRLQKATPTEAVLHFETIARLAIREDSSIDQLKAKALIKLFRPGREGVLTMLDFVKSVDAVYKEFRMLSATIENSSQIDRAFERMFDAIFYTVVVVIILSQLGFDPLALFLSLSSVIIAFGFAIGSSASRYLEGVFFILGRRPYGIGDFISIAEPGTLQSLDGALPWKVVNVTLYETALVYLPTNEKASLSNGSLASKMVINWARSPQAQFHIFLKFPLNTPYEKIVFFKEAIEEYMKARPREWRALNGFRANRIMTEENYLELIIVIQHRDAWQNVGQVLDSKANLSSYCQEVMRQLDLHYEAPRLPVDLTYSKAADKSAREKSAANGTELDGEALAKAFQAVARTKHKITTS